MTTESAIARVASFWDDAVARFIRTGDAVPAELDDWYGSYRGTGSGRVDRTALPEPFLGDLSSGARAVMLALNPGRAFDFQRREGAFVRDILAAGSYTAWAATWPYIDGGWECETGQGNRHHRNRWTFLKRWYEDDTLPPSAMVAFEMYPWHSTSITASMRPAPATIRRYVWEPISELRVPIWAFGAGWMPLLDRLGLPEVTTLRAGDPGYPSTAGGRVVKVFRAPADGCVIAEKHSGGAGPPSALETRILRDALEHALRGTGLSATG